MKGRPLLDPELGYTYRVLICTKKGDIAHKDTNNLPSLREGFNDLLNAMRALGYE